MNQTNKIIIGASVLVVGGTVGYIGYKNYKKKQLLSLENPKNPKNPNLSTSSSVISSIATRIVPGYVPNRFPIGKGMKGNEVMRIQAMLNKKFNASLKVDGLFGSKTEAALYRAIGKKTLSAQDFAKYAKYE